MKKSIILVVLAAAFILTSCSTYTCPTYSKAPVKKEVKENRL